MAKKATVTKKAKANSDLAAEITAKNNVDINIGAHTTHCIPKGLTFVLNESETHYENEENALSIPVECFTESVMENF